MQHQYSQPIVFKDETTSINCIGPALYYGMLYKKSLDTHHQWDYSSSRLKLSSFLIHADLHVNLVTYYETSLLMVFWILFDFCAWFS